MTMTLGLSKFALTAHIPSSVGWLGAVAGFPALAVAGLTRHDVQKVPAAYPERSSGAGLEDAAASKRSGGSN